MSKALGHQNQRLFLDKMLSGERMSHAYLFCGPDNTAKKEIALEFALKVMNAKESKINPDLILVNGAEAGIEQMRELLSTLSLHPYQHQKKVAVIENFDRVNAESANSILKTLEEPNNSSVIILLASSRQTVLPTIVSRCQVLYFSKENESVIDEEAKELFFQIQKLSPNERLASIKKVADKETVEVEALLNTWLEMESVSFLKDSPKKYSNLQLLLEGISGLRQNFNKKFVLQKIFLNLN